MDFSIAGILLVDGLANGAIYTLLGLAIVLVFTVTRVIFIPQGEFVAYGALTLAIFQTGRLPGTVWLLGVGAALSAPLVLVADLREGRGAAAAGKAALRELAAPAAICAAAVWGSGAGTPILCRRLSRWPSSRRWDPWSTAWPSTRWPVPARWCC
jgi:branched-chain amino acid transport system permease protein